MNKLIRKVSCIILTSVLLLSNTYAESPTSKDLKFKMVAANGSYSTFLTEDGDVYSCGVQIYGTFEDTVSDDRIEKIHKINELKDITAIASGISHSVAIKKDGTVWSWGDNYFGQLGNGTKINCEIPVQANGITDAVAVACSAYATFILKKDGTVWQWGIIDEVDWSNSVDQFITSVPVQVPELSNVKSISGGFEFCAALKNDGTVWVWGDDDDIRLKYIDEYVKTPIQVKELKSIVKIATGQYHTLALSKDGVLMGWGTNNYGELSDGTYTDRSIPVKSKVDKVIDIYAGGRMSLVIKKDGSLWTCGINWHGERGTGKTSDSEYYYEGYTLSKITNLNSTTQVSIGSDLSSSYVLALKKDKTIWGWGCNKKGQLGIKPASSISKPFQIKIKSN